MILTGSVRVGSPAHCFFSHLSEVLSSGFRKELAIEFFLLCRFLLHCC